MQLPVGRQVTFLVFVLPAPTVLLLALSAEEERQARAAALLAEEAEQQMPESTAAKKKKKGKRGGGGGGGGSVAAAVQRQAASDGEQEEEAPQEPVDQLARRAGPAAGGSATLPDETALQQQLGLERLLLEMQQAEQQQVERQQQEPRQVQGQEAAPAAPGAVALLPVSQDAPVSGPAAAAAPAPSEHSLEAQMAASAAFEWSAVEGADDGWGGAPPRPASSAADDWHDAAASSHRQAAAAGKQQSAQTRPAELGQRVIGWDGEWVCSCGDVHGVTWDCKTCAILAPCRRVTVAWLAVCGRGMPGLWGMLAGPASLAKLLRQANVAANLKGC